MSPKSIYVQQLDEADCGVAALSMILKNFHSNVSLSSLRNLAQTDKNGTTALGLVTAAESFNLKTTAIKADMSLFTDYDERKLPLPFIVHVNKKEGLLHYLVVLQVTPAYILVADPDPAVKITKMTPEEFAAIWTGVTIFMEPTSRYTPISESTDSLWHTARLLLKHRLIVATVIGLTFGSTLITITGARFLQSIIDSIVPLHLSNLLLIISLCLLVAYLFHGLFTFLEGYLSSILSVRLSKDLLLEYLQHLFRLPINFFETRKVGEITSRFDDASNIINTLAKTAIVTILNLGTVLVIGIFLLHISPVLFLISTISIPLYLLVIRSFVKVFDKWNHRRMEQGAVLNTQIIDDLSGIATIKSLNADTESYEAIRQNFLKGLNYSLKYSYFVTLQEAIKDVLMLLINLGILFWGANLAIGGSISIGELVAFNALMGYFLGPIEELIGLQDEIQTAKVANTRLNQILSAPEEQSGTTSLPVDGTAPLSIDLKSVSFEYKYGNPVLSDINLTIDPGESMTIVGLSGSGKSTLAKLLVGFHSPTEGSINIGGNPLNSIDHSSLRSHISYVPQSPYIFSGSVLSNITLGSASNVSLDKVMEAAKMAEIHQDILALPNGYETQISSEYGLSGGQMQRIAIARAIFSDRSVLIFDESTSNLDVLTEEKVLDNLLKLHNKTIIFIAHRLSVAQKTDRIMVMKNGHIVESGEHSELLHTGKYYKQLWHH